MKENLQTLSVEELVKAFVGFALQQDMALFDDDIREVNRLFFKLESVEAELKSRPGDQRSALLPLFEHPNPQVQVKAAKATLAIAPVAARHVLQTIEKTCRGPQQLEAGMSLLNLDRGVFKPT